MFLGKFDVDGPALAIWALDEEGKLLFLNPPDAGVLGSAPI